MRFIAALLIAVSGLFAFATAASAQVVPVDSYQSEADNSITATTIRPAITNGNTSTAANPAQSTGTTVAPAAGPNGPAGPANGEGANASVNLNLNEALNKPSQSILIIILITILSVSPALLIMLTSFTRIIIVLSLVRNAMGLMTIPPSQVLTGLALFLSFFIMAPTFTEMNNNAIQPYLRGELTQDQAYDTAVKPLRTFMLKQTRDEEIALFTQIADDEKPKNKETISMVALAPAFVLSELKTAFIIGFVIFIPFLVIDLIVSSSLMAMGMMMLPPQMISLPFKLLLFVLVDGWGLIIRALITSFQ